MSSHEGGSRRIAIMRELLDVTNDMLGNRANVDVLLEHVDKRQELIDEFEDLKEIEGYEISLTAEETSEIQDLAQLILEKDNAINTLLVQYRDESKKEVNDNTRQQRVLGYANKAISSSGSYMDFKK